jgi:hypothetical protein
MTKAVAVPVAFKINHEFSLHVLNFMRTNDEQKTVLQYKMAVVVLEMVVAFFIM